ncbi:hypothetical protein AeRB84_018158 [Aphanomyces euteiches]|nr:hypothetical protein AeRB84_018158 [Aphanomyces euteiches]
MLSTSTLTLETSENFSTVLAGSETCWLVVVITDLAVLITKDHTTNLTFPVQPRLVVARTCEAVEFDLQLLCQAGVVQIGSRQRAIDLVLLTRGVLLVCYLWEKWRYPHFQLPAHKLSLWLPAGAFYLYEKQPWIIDDTLYLDRVSAFMCGLLAVTHKASIYLLDIKTWRTYTIAIDPKFDTWHLFTSSFDKARLADAIPMIK